MILDATSAGQLLELLDPDLKNAIDYEFSRGNEQTTLKELLKNLDEFTNQLNDNLTPLIGILEPFSGVLFQADLTSEILDFWKPKRVRIHSLDNIFVIDDPLGDSIRYDDEFYIPIIYESPIEYEIIHDKTNIIEIDISVQEDIKYNKHPGHYSTVEQSTERLSVDGEEWQAGGFTPFDGPIDSTMGIDDPWEFDAPFGCDFCHIQLLDATSNVFVYYPGVGGDDYNWGTPPDFFQGGTSNPGFGYTGAVRFNLGVRFVNVNIPQGAVIARAYLRLTSKQAQAGDTCKVKMYGNDADNAVAPTNYTQAEALVLTSSLTSWNPVPHFDLSSKYQTPDITSIVQEIVNRPGWSSGNALQILVKDDISTSGAYRYIRSIDYDPSDKAELVVYWIL